MIRATYLGFQEGYREMPGFELWNLIDQAGHHLPGSTVTRGTIEKFGTLISVPKE